MTNLMECHNEPRQHVLQSKAAGEICSVLTSRRPVCSKKRLLCDLVIEQPLTVPFNLS